MPNNIKMKQFIERFFQGILCNNLKLFLFLGTRNIKGWFIRYLPPIFFFFFFLCWGEIVDYNRLECLYVEYYSAKYEKNYYFGFISSLRFAVDTSSSIILSKQKNKLILLNLFRITKSVGFIEENKIWGTYANIGFLIA